MLFDNKFIFLLIGLLDTYINFYKQIINITSVYNIK